METARNFPSAVGRILRTLPPSLLLMSYCLRSEHLLIYLHLLYNILKCFSRYFEFCIIACYRVFYIILPARGTDPQLPCQPIFPICVRVYFYIEISHHGEDVSSSCSQNNSASLTLCVEVDAYTCKMAIEQLHASITFFCARRIPSHLRRNNTVYDLPLSLFLQRFSSTLCQSRISHVDREIELVGDLIHCQSLSHLFTLVM